MSTRKNLIILLLAGAFQAFSMGIYETALPLFLQEKGISYIKMSIIFGLSQLGLIVIRFVAGAKSDTTGRKPFMIFSLTLSSIASLFTPLFTNSIGLVLMKTAQDLSGMVREVMRSIMVYEHSAAKFVRWIGRVMGAEFFFMAFGAVSVGGIVSFFGYQWAFWLAALCSLIALVIMTVGFTPIEKCSPNNGPKQVPEIRVLSSINLPYNLWILGIMAFVFNIGISASHSFYMLLFFKDKFGFSAALLGTVQMLHRFSLGIPMIATGGLMDKPGLKKHFRTIFYWALTIQGLLILGSSMVPIAWLATILWLIHDLFGATFWNPINAWFLQSNAREASRGSDIALVSGLGSIGAVFGPFLAGVLLNQFHWTNGPFFISGVFIMVAAGFVWLMKQDAGRDLG